MGVCVREKPKGSGVWWIFINHHGRRKSKRVGDKRLAMEAAKQIEARLTLGDLDLGQEEQKPTFQEYASLWLEDYIKPLRKPSTHRRYQDILSRHVFPDLGNNPIDRITRGEVRNLLLKKYKGGLSKSMVCLIRDVISGPMNYAIDEEILQANPVTGILRRLKLERDKKIEVEPMTHDEVDIFLMTAENHFREYHPILLTACRTGMRMGELLALRWGDIDFNQKFIHVQRAYRRGRVDKTKTGRTRRVDMSDQLILCLGALLTERKKEALKHGRNEPQEIIFHRDGKHMEQNHLRRVFKRVLKKAGMRELRFHDLRHTFASLLLSNGVTPVYVKEQLGHSSIEMTVDIYGHLIPSSNREAVNQLDNQQPTAPYAHPPKIKRL